MPYQVTINQEKCNGCEECMEACTVQVLKMGDGKSTPVKDQKCIGCQRCMDVCKEKAITVEELKTDLSKTVQSLLKDILYE